MIYLFVILSLIAVLVIIFLLIYFLVYLQAPKERVLTTRKVIDVVIVGEHDDNRRNVEQYLGDMVDKIYTVKKESDLISRLGVSRLKRFFLVLKPNMLFTGKITPQDFFATDELAFVHSQKNVISHESAHDRRMLAKIGGLRFKFKTFQSISSVPVLIDKHILLELISKRDVVRSPPYHFLFYFYPNYVIATGKALLCKKHSFHYVVTGDVSSFDLVQRKFVYVDPAQPKLQHKFIKRLS